VRWRLIFSARGGDSTVRSLTRLPATLRNGHEEGDTKNSQGDQLKGHCEDQDANLVFIAVAEA
jgi:hypothetical protein